MPFPTVQVKLSPSGELELLLQDSRTVPLRTGEVQTTLKRVLQGMARQQHLIGQEGSPTRQQALHWQNHSIFPNDRCAFCRAELMSAALARGDSPMKAHGRVAKQISVLQATRADGVQITRVPPKATRQATTKPSKDLGL